MSGRPTSASCGTTSSRSDWCLVDDGAPTGTCRDPFAGPHRTTAVPMSVDHFGGESLPAWGDMGHIVWSVDAKADPSFSSGDATQIG